MRTFLLINSLLLSLAFSSCNKKHECPPIPETPVDNTNLKVGLIAYYPFTGNAADSSGFKNHGSVNGATLTTDRLGTNNRAYSFDGNLDYINIGNNPILKRYQSDFTVAAWIKLTAYSSSYGEVLLSNRNHNLNPVSGSMFGIGGQLSSQYKKFQIVQNATPSSDIYGYDYSYSTQDIPLNQWVHLVFTYKYNGGGANDSKTYINGTLDASQTLKEILDPGTGSTFIGCEPNLAPPEYSFNGSMDDVRIYNRVLSADEVKQLFNYK